MNENLLTFVLSSYLQHEHQLPLILHSLAVQTDKRFEVIVVHDGGKGSFDTLNVCNEFPFVKCFSTPGEPARDYGYTPRELGIDKVETPYITLSSADNYYAPTFVERFLNLLTSLPFDFVYCNALMNYGGYKVMETRPTLNNIDLGCFVTRTEWVQKLRFEEKSYGGDGIFVERLFREYSVLYDKIEEALFTHN